MKHLRKFSSVEAMQAEIAKAEVDFVGLAYDAKEGTAKVRIAKEVPPDPKATPFYIDVRGPVTLTPTSGLQMSTDGKTWKAAAGDLPTGKTYFRVASDQTSPLKLNWTENDNSDYDIGGNINSLVKTSFENDTTGYSFYINYTGFFQNKSKLKSAGDLILPATTMAQFGYANMFEECTSLTTAPALPATTLAGYCYQYMFSRCTSLTSAPELPATTLAGFCYQAMFINCFKLNYIKCLATDISASRCLQNWVSQVALSGTFVKAASMTTSSWGSGVNGIPSGWTTQDA